MGKKKKLCLAMALTVACSTAWAQTYLHYTTTAEKAWQETKMSMKGKAAAEPLIVVNGQEEGRAFRAWGTCFNELDLDAIRLLPEETQQEVMRRIFAPDGDLRFTRGRLTMNANDYSRGWYSCDTVAGDFALKYFNIEHDKQNVIQLIKMAQKYQPAMTFWMSPWSPPAWMKINQDYPVISSRYNKQPKTKDYLLFEGNGQIDANEVMMAGQQKGLFPKRLAAQCYMIQDERYLQAYANMFGRFIELYAQEQIPIDMVMYQNEAYSYTAYPGCAWTAEGTLRFNRDFLIPTLRKQHPEVEVNIGTLNTNRYAYVTRFIDGLKEQVKAVGLQWEGRQIIDSLRQRYPALRFISTESECGNGRMDWRAAEHTFMLLCDYIGRGCDEYYIWNFILCDDGKSPWGWKQNALIQVDSKTRQHRYTGEYYAVKHFSRFVVPGSRMVGYAPQKDGLQAIVFVTPQGKRIVIANNSSNEARPFSVKIGKKYITEQMAAHSMHTFVEK